MISGVHDVAGLAVDAISERAAWMIQGQHADLKAADLNLARTHQRARRPPGEVIEGHWEIRRAEDRLDPFERYARQLWRPDRRRPSRLKKRGEKREPLRVIPVVVGQQNGYRARRTGERFAEPD